MKKIYIPFIASFLLLANIDTVSATKITVQVASFSFTPAVVNATVGDTIQWVWVSGNHTTTCSGNGATSLPAGALTWNSPMNSSVTTYEYVLAVAGTYTYVCNFHSSMVGTLNVSAASGINTISSKATFLEINPPAFKNDAIIKFSLTSTAKVQLSIYDFSGRKIETLINELLTTGEHTATWDAANMPQGTYFCRLESTDFTITKKFVRIK